MSSFRENAVVSAFLGKAGVAAAAGDRCHAAAPLQAQPSLAAGALEVLVLLAVAPSYLELAQFGAPLGGFIQIDPVFGVALFNVAGKHTENGVYIAEKRQIPKEHDARDEVEQQQRKACIDDGARKLIGAVAAVHIA